MDCPAEAWPTLGPGLVEKNLRGKPRNAGEMSQKWSNVPEDPEETTISLYHPPLSILSIPMAGKIQKISLTNRRCYELGIGWGMVPEISRNGVTTQRKAPIFI